MNLVEFDDVSLKFGMQQILVHSNLAIRPNERVCLIGRNGAGKSTLFRLILQQQHPDSGEIRYKNHLRISMLQQQMPEVETDLRVIDVVRQGLADLQNLLDSYKKVSEQPDPDQGELIRLQQAIEAQDGWDIEVKIQRIITQLSLPAEEKLGDLSGGWQRRVLLGKALVSNPHLLLLDEPTNHLDIRHQLEVLELIRNLPLTIETSLHDLNLAAGVCDSVMLLKAGHTIGFGPPAHVLSETIVSDAFQVKTRREHLSYSGTEHLTFHLQDAGPHT